MSREVSEPGSRRMGSLLVRLATIVLAAFVIGWLLNQLALQLDRTNQPAGFLRGMVQGALTPAAMPNLLVGYDVTFYSVNNRGVPYKLGYTLGINVCGLFFFGGLYWRMSRWRKRG